MSTQTEIQKCSQCECEYNPAHGFSILWDGQGICLYCSDRMDEEEGEWF